MADKNVEEQKCSTVLCVCVCVSLFVFRLKQKYGLVSNEDNKIPFQTLFWLFARGENN